ncbi:MAG: PEP-CTERM sorting domain-containing protein [Rivularia sp. ALOHA_DT_140]|nr:PEP-CTERM sorting domain-containing protein [Rivularia sp. ALOHA_DT_140]
MNKKNKLIQKFLLIAAPILAISVSGISPSRAATFASSTSEVEFKNFSQDPFQISTFANSVPLVFGEGDIASADAEADAFAEFLTSPVSASNSNLSKAFGDNRSYLAVADSESEIIGNFEIAAGTNFSFDFTADLNLETSIDNPTLENSRADGDILFLLVDTGNDTVLDFFNLAGSLNALGDDDSVDLEVSENVTLDKPSINTNFGGLDESLQASVSGSFNRNFANQTNLALIEYKLNTVLVKAPESSTGLALLLSSGAIGIMLKRRRK